MEQARQNPDDYLDDEEIWNLCNFLHTASEKGKQEERERILRVVQGCVSASVFIRISQALKGGLERVIE